MRENVRIREFVPSCARATTTYDAQLSLTLSEAGLAPAKVLVLEVRQPGKVRVINKQIFLQRMCMREKA